MGVYPDMFRYRDEDGKIVTDYVAMRRYRDEHKYDMIWAFPCAIAAIVMACAVTFL